MEIKRKIFILKTHHFSTGIKAEKCLGIAIWTHKIGLAKVFNEIRPLEMYVKSGQRTNVNPHKKRKWIESFRLAAGG